MGKITGSPRFHQLRQAKAIELAGIVSRHDAETREFHDAYRDILRDEYGVDDERETLLELCAMIGEALPSPRDYSKGA